MMCNPDQCTDGDRIIPPVLRVQPNPFETSESSLVERVCAFLERYASAHSDDAGLLCPAGAISAGRRRNA